MKDRKLFKILQKYCDRIRFNNVHYVCYPKGSKKVIVVSATPSDGNYLTQVKQDFRRIGIIIEELK